MDQKKLEEESRLGVSERNSVQIKIIEKMIESGDVKDEMEWAKKYSKSVSDIIDNPHNELVRELILGSKVGLPDYSQAAELVISLLLSSERAA